MTHDDKLHVSNWTKDLSISQYISCCKSSVYQAYNYQIGKNAPGLIKNLDSSEINNIAQQRINWVICQGGQEIERILPKILRGAIEDAYQTLLKLLGKFGKQHQQKKKDIKIEIAILLLKFTTIVFYKESNKNYIF